MNRAYKARIKFDPMPHLMRQCQAGVGKYYFRFGRQIYSIIGRLQMNPSSNPSSSGTYSDREFGTRVASSISPVCLAEVGHGQEHQQTKSRSNPVGFWQHPGVTGCLGSARLYGKLIPDGFPTGTAMREDSNLSDGSTPCDLTQKEHPNARQEYRSLRNLR